jgi:flagellar basal body-associated protein FliL
MTYLLFGTALALSACAAYYSIMGLVAIFAAAATPIFIMGTLLETSKLVVASWIYRNWKEVPVLMKTYFTVSLIILMMLTSMGIFGYLSKAHLDQAIPTGDVSAKLALIDEKIKTEKENINANRKELTQLDTQVDQTISRTTDANGTDRAISIRRAQQKDRQRILKEIGESQIKIAKFNEERAPIASEVRKVEAEVGPIKYIAAILYGDNPETDVLEKAVRWVIIMIVMVFDPLAVLLLVAANWQQKRESENEGIEGNEEIVMSQIPIKETTENKLENPLDNTNLSTKEDISVVENPVVDNYPTLTSEDELDIKIDESKDWEANLYDRIDRRDETLPLKTKSFLSKSREVFSSVGIKSTEQEVEDIQTLKS